tara:strand:+ start:7178 stop:7810 length:633 start_codon:yes stop_codon:yes gene_type:complete
MNKQNFKKAAMFGLDARIALAIFGALSVISGAALYSAIQQAKVTSIVAELEEMSKAYQAYVLDVGSELEGRTAPVASDIALQTAELLSSTKAGWNGPYLPFSTDDMNAANPQHVLDSEKYETIFIIRTVDDSSFGNYTTGGSQTTCVGNNTSCSIFIGLNNVGSIELAKAIDVMVDGAEGADSGRLRVRNHATTKYAVYYQVMPSLNQND